jgi:hypothetical protein
VRLGHKPVRYDGKRSSVRLTFPGRRGQLVELAHWSEWTEDPCVRTSLHRSTSRTVAAWATGYWRLPRTGTYTAVLRPCGDDRTSMRVQVRKVEIRDASIDGPAMPVDPDPDVTHLLRVRVADGELVSVRPSRTPRHLIRPDRTIEAPATGWFLLSGAGRHRRAARPGTTIAVSRVLDHAGTLDGSAVELDNAGVEAREHAVAFTAQAGQWVYPELQDASGAAIPDVRARTVVLRAGATRLDSHVLTPCPGTSTTQPCDFLVNGPWQVPATGTYRMVTAVGGSAASYTFSLRVRSAAVAPPLALDGPPVTYTSTAPGQWVVGSYTEGLTGSAVARAVRASESLTDWRLSLAAGFPNVCPPRDTSNGCADYFVASLTPGSPTQRAPQDGNTGPATAVLTVPPGVMGSLEVSLRHE